MDKARWPALKARLGEVFATKTRDEWCALMEHTDVCFAPVLTMSEAAEHPHNVARATIVERRRRQAAGAGAALQPHDRRDRPAAGTPRPAHPRGARGLGHRQGPHRRARRGRRRRRAAAADRRARRLLGRGRRRRRDGVDTLGGLMATIVFVHAHPDDEASSTGGSMARAAAEGHRVVLVVCTDGEHGESPDDLADGETLVDRRRRETEASAAVLGVARVVWLGYGDSGMTGWDAERRSGLVLAGRPRRGRRAAGGDPARGARRRRRALRLARRLRPPRPHPGPPRRPPGRRPGRHAAAVRGDVQPRRPEAAGWRAHPEQAREDFDPDGPADDGNPFGTPEAELHLAVDVAPYIAAEAAGARRPRQPGHRHRHVPRHARGRLRRLGGTEWFIEPGAATGSARRLAARRR